MRRAAAQATVGVLVLLGATCLLVDAAASQEPFVLYEDWKTSTNIRGDRWAGGGGPSQDIRKEQVGHKTLMRLRRGGLTSSDVGFQGGSATLALVNPLAVTQIEATFNVKSLSLTGCIGVAGTFSSALPATVSLNKLYDGTPRSPGSLLGDHFGRIQVVRVLDSLDPPGALRVQATVFRCQDPACAGVASIPGGLVEFPDLVFVGDKFRLRLVWDQPNNRFLAGLNDGPDVAVSYPATLVPTPGGPFSIISMVAAGANCTAGPGVSDATVEVRQVMTNAAAVVP